MKKYLVRYVSADGNILIRFEVAVATLEEAVPASQNVLAHIVRDAIGFELSSIDKA